MGMELRHIELKWIWVRRDEYCKSCTGQKYHTGIPLLPVHPVKRENLDLSCHLPAAAFCKSFKAFMTEYRFPSVFTKFVCTINPAVRADSSRLLRICDVRTCACVSYVWREFITELGRVGGGCILSSGVHERMAKRRRETISKCSLVFTFASPPNSLLPYRSVNQSINQSINPSIRIDTKISPVTITNTVSNYGDDVYVADRTQRFTHTHL